MSCSHVPVRERQVVRKALTFLLLLAFAFDATAQTVRDHRPQNDPTRDTLIARSTEIVVPFVALDKSDHIISDLHSEDVHVYDEGVERTLTSLLLEDGPASVLFIIDVSRSMKKVLPYVSDAVGRILTSAVDGDEFAVLEFSDDAAVTVEFTSTETDVRNRIRELTSLRRTSLVDAMVRGLSEIRRGRHDRKAIVIITDGRDNHSRYKERDAIRIAMETDVRIYGIELYPLMGEGYIPKTLLESLAEITGGRYLPTVRLQRVPELMSKFDVHRFYRATYRMPTAAMDAKYHRIELKLSRTERLRGLKLFWKRGYDARPD